MNKYITISALALLMLTGCVRSDYVGQKFAATPLHQEVKFFKSRADMPQDEYTIIGRFTVTAPEKSDLYTFQKELTEKGRACGGDAVCLVSIETVRTGAYSRKHEEFGAPAPGSETAPNVDAAQLGPRQALTGERAFSVRRRARALLLKKRDSVKKLLE
ncbi:MAG: hypothetical protein IKC89_03465 [Lentisphaeria bacterium]|nr:hypothetical protein [Lentisphaeria bacterium]